MKMTCENCCTIFKKASHCPACGSVRIKGIIIVNQNNNKRAKRKVS